MHFWDILEKIIFVILWLKNVVCFSYLKRSTFSKSFRTRTWSIDRWSRRYKPIWHKGVLYSTTGAFYLTSVVGMFYYRFGVCRGRRVGVVVMGVGGATRVVTPRRGGRRQPTPPPPSPRVTVSPRVGVSPDAVTPVTSTACRLASDAVISTNTAKTVRLCVSSRHSPRYYRRVILRVRGAAWMKIRDQLHLQTRLAAE